MGHCWERYISQLCIVLSNPQSTLKSWSLWKCFVMLIGIALGWVTIIQAWKTRLVEIPGIFVDELSNVFLSSMQAQQITIFNCSNHPYLHKTFFTTHSTTRTRHEPIWLVEGPSHLFHRPSDLHCRGYCSWHEWICSAHSTLFGPNENILFSLSKIQKMFCVL